MLILTSGLGVFLRWTNTGQDARKQIFAAIGEQVSPALAENIRQALEQVQDHAGVGGPIGLVTLLVAALAIFSQFQRAFDQIWNVPEKPKRKWYDSALDVMVHRLRAFVMLTSLGLIVFAVFCAGIALNTFRNFAPDRLANMQLLWWGLETTIGIVLNASVFSLLYRALPRVRIAWKFAIRGGIVAAGIWEIGRQILASVVIGQHYTSAYGIIGSMLAIMLWIYYASAVVFVGAEYVEVLRERCQEPDECDPLQAGPTLRRAADLSLLLFLLYLGSFVYFRQCSTLRLSQLPDGDPRQVVVIFSQDPQTHQVARDFYTPLIAVLSGGTYFPSGEEVELINVWRQPPPATAQRVGDATLRR